MNDPHPDDASQAPLPDLESEFIRLNAIPDVSFPPPPPPAAGIPGLPPVVGPTTVGTAAPLAVAIPSGPPARDRIVVLGRRKSGKTVFIARQYERLWNSRGEIHMEAIDGPTHVELMKEIAAMLKGLWPAATVGLRSFKLTITYRGQKHLMIAPDYPGELFQRAFMENSDEPLARELRDNIDRAAAIILIVDPGVALDGDVLNQADQDYGLVAAVKRLRDWPGAEHVPVAVVLSKCDLYRPRLEAEGGIGNFMRDRMSNLFRAVKRESRVGEIFACAAIRTKQGPGGNPVPDLSKPPKGLIEPLEFCLKGIEEMRRRQRALDLKAEAQRVADDVQQREAAAARKSMLIGAVLVGFAVLIGLVVVAVLLSGRR